MADIYYPNKAPAASNDWFSHGFFLSRLLLKSGWVYKASSDGSSKETTGDITLCKWGAPASISNTGSGATISTKLGLDLLLTGLSGLISPTRTNQGGSEGNYLTISGAANSANNGTFQITNVISSSSCYVRNSSAIANDANTITWTEKSALTTTYSSMSSGAWLVLRGPSTLKIPFTTAPTGTFLRGENIVQATSLAECECLGVTFEPSTGIGYLVASPRLNGSGSIRGFDTSHIITGSKSGATFTPSGTIIEYGREIMLQRGANLFDATSYYCCLDLAAESASLFSTLAGSAGCTATIAPGEGGTSNAFPATGCLVAGGTGGSVAHQTAGWNRSTYNTANAIGNMQAFVANCIERQNVSADGSWCTAHGQPITSNQSFGGSWCLQRCDNGEEGDIDPYVIYAPIGNGTLDARSRTAVTTQCGATETWVGSAILGNIGADNWVAFRRRGLSGEAFVTVQPCMLGNSRYTANYLQVQSSASTDPEKVASTAQTSNPLVLDPLTLISFVSGAKVRKGSPRYIFSINGNLGSDTFGGKTWLQPSPFTAGALNTMVFIFPYDGSTVPVQ